MILDENSKNLINLFVNNGYTAYAVGGCVRDAIMDVEAKDIDITTSATPEQIISVLSQNYIRYIETGIKHGTVTAIVNHIPYEITTYRVDGEYNDNRHPNDVEFVTDVTLDLSRRDFTMNAIAYNDYDGFVDPFNGEGDIAKRVIRAVGDPNVRFNEDALRIMRAIRFSSVLGFDIEDGTKEAIHNNKELLNNIAAERVYTELIKLLLGDNVENVLLEYKDVIAVIMPEIVPTFTCEQNTKWHLYDVYTHCVKSVGVSPKIDYIRFAMLMHDIGKPGAKITDDNGTDHFYGHAKISKNISQEILKRLKVSTDFFNKTITLIDIHDEKIRKEPYIIKQWLNRLGEELIFDFVDVKIADMKTHNMEYTAQTLDRLVELKSEIKKVIDSNEPYKISQLAINGNDLVSLGYKGKDVSIQLTKLLDTVMQNPSLNNKENLISISKKDSE